MASKDPNINLTIIKALYLKYDSLYSNNTISRSPPLPMSRIAISLLSDTERILQDPIYSQLAEQEIVNALSIIASKILDTENGE